MGCPSALELESVLRGVAAAAEEAAMARHLATCPACRRAMEDLAGGSAWQRADRSLGDVAAGTLAHSHLESAIEGLRAASGELFHGVDATEGAASGAEPGAGGRFEFLAPADGPGLLGRLGPYEVMEHVASGGMGLVFKGRDPVLGRIVALKVLAPALARHPVARSRFIREARAAAAVVHEHVVSIHAVDSVAGLPYLVMQFVKGRSLAERLRATGPMRLEEMLRIGAQIASGLAAAHAQGLIHRDVKPGNVLLENSVERVKLTDFGLARAVDDSGLTQAGEIAGTPEFMSPEQASGSAVDARSDLFGLGCILYAMATGVSPFRASGSLAVLRRVCEFDPIPLAEAVPGIPRWFGEGVARLLAKKPEDRFESAAEVGRWLEEGLRAHEQGRSPAGAAPQRRGWRRLALSRRALALGAVFVMLVLGLVWAGWVTLNDRAANATSSRAQENRPALPGASGAVAAPPGLERGPAAFAIGETEFPRLSEAIAAAAPGETIEVRFDGGRLVEPVDIPPGKPLRLVAAPGFRPILRYAGLERPLVASESSLVLEGLAFEPAAWPAAGEWRLRNRLPPSLAAHPAARERPGGGGRHNPGSRPLSAVIRMHPSASFAAAYCRFGTAAAAGGRPDHGATCLELSARRPGRLTGCELYAFDGFGLEFSGAQAAEDAAGTSAGSLEVEQTLFLGRDAFHLAGLGRGGLELTLRGCTISAVNLFSAAAGAAGALSVGVTNNLFDLGGVLGDRGRLASSRFPSDWRWRAGGNVYGGTARDLPGAGLAPTNWLEAEARVMTLSFPRLASWRGALNELRAEQFSPVWGANAGGRVEIREGADLLRIGPGPAWSDWSRGPEAVAWRRAAARLQSEEGAR